MPKEKKQQLQLRFNPRDRLQQQQHPRFRPNDNTIPPLQINIKREYLQCKVHHVSQQKKQ